MILQTDISMLLFCINVGIWILEWMYRQFSFPLLAKLWDARHGEVVHTFDHEHIVKSVNFNCDDTLLLTASNEKIIRVFDLNKPEAGRKLTMLRI